jgi:hypothetical protein
MAAVERQLDREYLVRVDDCHFLHSVEDRTVNSTNVPSAATSFGYEEADQICRRLRRRGFPMCVVTNIDGRPATYADIKR